MRLVLSILAVLTLCAAHGSLRAYGDLSPNKGFYKSYSVEVSFPGKRDKPVTIASGDRDARGLIVETTSRTDMTALLRPSIPMFWELEMMDPALAGDRRPVVTTNRYRYDATGKLLESFSETLTGEKKTIRRLVQEYDDQGRVTKTADFSDGEETSVTRYQYGPGVTKTETFAKGALTSRTTTKLDAAGRTTQVVTELPDGKSGMTYSRFEAKYDSAGRSLSEATFDGQDNPVSLREFEYGADGKLRRSTYTEGMAPGGRRSRTVTTYEGDTTTTEADGKLTDRTVTTREGEAVTTESFSYSPEGVLLRRSVSRHDTKGDETSYFDQNGAETKTRSWRENGLNHTETSYGQNRQLVVTDDDGFPREVKNVDSMGHTIRHTTYAYEYDKVGNWTRIQRFDKDVLVSVMGRKIVYQPAPKGTFKGE